MKGHMHGMKNKAPFGHTDGTHGKIEKEMRKHRASGGGVESAKKGDDQAEEDLKGRKTWNTRRTAMSIVSPKKKKATKGGKIARKSGGPVSGQRCFQAWWSDASRLWWWLRIQSFYERS